MTCIELQESLAEFESGGTAEQRAHLKSCRHCSALIHELDLIASSAASLREADEPSPRVWNAIEIVLRREGLIHPPRPNRSLVPAFDSRWAWARWLVPAAAALLVLVGIYVRQHSGPRITSVATPPVVRNAVPDATIAGLNDDDLLQEISRNAPEKRAQYAEHLRRANQYIQDAQDNVRANPNDAEARRSLLEACQQKSMLFELAMDRSLP
jgi:hypothetical protein